MIEAAMAIIATLIVASLMVWYLEGGTIKWGKDSCPQGGEHDIYYQDYGYTYQERICRKCGRKTIVNK